MRDIWTIDRKFRRKNIAEFGSFTQQLLRHILPSTVLSFAVELSRPSSFTETSRYGCALWKTCANVLNHFSIDVSIEDLVTTGDHNIV